MLLSDVSIKRPVFATVIGLLLFLSRNDKLALVSFFQKVRSGPW